MLFFLQLMKQMNFEKIHSKAVTYSFCNLWNKWTLRRTIAKRLHRESCCIKCVLYGRIIYKAILPSLMKRKGTKQSLKKKFRFLFPPTYTSQNTVYETQFHPWKRKISTLLLVKYFCAGFISWVAGSLQ